MDEPRNEPHLDWQKGGTARVVALANDTVTLRSSTPSPPGSRIVGTLRASGDSMRVKIHGSKKQPEGDFVLEGRVIDLTRALRERLVALLEPAVDHAR